jgi:hypothetical protein
MGTFGGEILSSAFKEQSCRWGGMAREYVSKIIMFIHRFINTALEALCTDELVREQLRSAILEDILKRYRDAMATADFLVSLERNKRAYTLNHYFNDNLQKVRADRTVNRLEDKAHQELLRIEEYWPKVVYANTGPLVVPLEVIGAATAFKGNAEQVEEEIHDMLQAYYQVARKRLVDNVFDQAVDYGLLTGPNSPLTVFTQDWVIGLSEEQLDEIAAESTPTKARRQQLQKKIEELEAAVKILRH